ncbi:competence/damage-inducible protein A [Candidatus Izemoplasma sp. B36]|uniref:competence/damage-inducible protein A n=1 Tax=Candidatus Izemoplasma sp. B36 TaxID=3242468 RepID=UPI0035564152
MKTAVVTVGKEILTGKTINTNLTTIARKLKEIGIDVSRSFVIDDDKEEYMKILKIIDEKVVIFTGGLGPTIDDITRETVYEYFNVPIEIKEDALDTIQKYFDRMHIEKKNSNDKQALLPIDSIVLNNNHGTAPGVIFEVNNQIIILLPGPPNELKPMLEDVISYLKRKTKTFLYSNGFNLVGIGESTMEDTLQDFYKAYKEVNVAPYASPGEVKYVFTSEDKQKMHQAMDAFKQKYNKYIYGNLDDTLEGIVVNLLRHEHQILSIAESCTGGLVASRITKVDGASNCFHESFVTYSNEAKMKYLNVSEETLKQFGAVSEETALEMAINLKQNTKADITISITGIAGPTGGTLEKPVGLVYFGLAHKDKVISKHRIFNGSREIIQFRASQFALDMIRKELLKAI